MPTVGGEVVFDDAYARQLPRQRDVRRAAPGRPRHARAARHGPGNLVVLYGATTGRDGIGGASVLASQELGEDDADKRPSVQVGDPFTGKKLIEVSVELVERGLVAVAPGLRRGRARLVALGDGAPTAGIDVHLDRVPLREDGDGAVGDHDLRVQERMVAVVAPAAARRGRGGDATAGSCTAR